MINVPADQVKNINIATDVWHNMLKRIEVAVGIVFNAVGHILVAKRHSHQHQGARWEFPGGKVELGESVGSALKRELLEEVGIQVIKHEPWLEVAHDYEDKSVLLKVHRVLSFQGEPVGREGQVVQWVAIEQLMTLPLLIANETIVSALLRVADVENPAAVAAKL